MREIANKIHSQKTKSFNFISRTDIKPGKVFFENKETNIIFIYVIYVFEFIVIRAMKIFISANSIIISKNLIQKKMIKMNFTVDILHAIQFLMRVKKKQKMKRIM